MNKRLKFHNLLCSFFGFGYLPKMPGTWGTLAAFILYLFLPVSLYQGVARWVFLGFLAMLSLVCVYFIRKAERELGEDAPEIVIDEVLGYFVSTLFLAKSLKVGLAAFVLFRFFDILKPYPINISQKIRGGWGVLTDDLIAGVFANLVIRIITVVVRYF